MPKKAEHYRDYLHHERFAAGDKRLCHISLFFNVLRIGDGIYPQFFYSCFD